MQQIQLSSDTWAFEFLLDNTAAGCWVIIRGDLVLIAVNIVDVTVALPLVIHLGDGDQLHCLPLWEMVMLKAHLSMIKNSWALDEC